ncbi:primase-like DNA-binding domain-containing protein, partial [Intestinimonas butyriciproducens]
FDKCFTGRERKYIKEDYLTRPEVLEYVLYRVLTIMPQYYELPVPAACKTAADAFSLSNNPVMEFALECLPQMVKYDVYPFEILYILYKNYLKDNNPSSTSLGKNTFITELTRVL